MANGAAAVAVLIGSQRGGLGGDQALEDVWERAKLSQQQTRQSRRIGVQDDGEGAPGAPPCPPPTQRTERDQAVERRQSIRQGGSDSGSQGRQETERSYRSGGSPRGTGEDPQERHEAHRVKGGRDNDGVSPKFSSQGSRRVTLTLWTEGEDGEGSKEGPKMRVPRSERSAQCLEDASQAKQEWVDHIRATEAQDSTNRERGQELQHIKERDRVKTLLSLLKSAGAHRTYTVEEGQDLLREGSVWIHIIMRPCLQAARTRGDGLLAPRGRFRDAGGGDQDHKCQVDLSGGGETRGGEVRVTMGETRGLGGHGISAQTDEELADTVGGRGFIGDSRGRPEVSAHWGTANWARRGPANRLSAG